MMTGMDEFIRALPKAELHVHLEGSVESATLMELDPSLSLDDIQSRYAYANFRGFLDSYKWVTGYLRTPSDYALITRRLLERLHREGVVHAEINISAGVVLWRNQDLDSMFEAVASEAARHPLSTMFVFDAVRQFGVDAAWAVARHAVKLRGLGVVGFGIGGDELSMPVRCFLPVIDFARSHGLYFTPHAGETGPSASVRDAIQCGASRIGHGISAVSDPGLMGLLIERDVPLEICISSNVCTGVVESMERHPVRVLWDAGVPIVLNSDDPPMFGTTLLNEYLLAFQHFGFDRSMLQRAAENSLRYSFGS